MSPNSAFALAQDSSLTNSLKSYCAAVEQRITAVEHFKSKNSILKNSIRYLPLEIDHMKGTVLENLGQALLNGIYRHNDDPSREGAQAILDTFAALEAKSLKVAEPYAAAAIANLEPHLNILLRETAQRQSLQKEILSPKVTSALTELRESYNRWHDEQSIRASRFHYGLFALSALLGFVVLWMFRKLAETTSQLALANATLEEKVEVRTKALTAAMSELEDNQAAMAQSAKMVALGEMAGGIAHEINTPLSAILISSEMLAETAAAKGQTEIVQGWHSIVKIVEKISKIILGLRRFSRDGTRDAGQENLASTIISETLVLCRESFLANSIRFEFDDQTQGRKVICVAEQISQVLLNLFTNSVHALQDLNYEAKWIHVSAASTGDRVEISVTDGGCGIPESVRSKLMQPFFTTKPAGKGTGLGLSISKGIVEHHGGTLRYDEGSKHTRFVITLPCSIPAAIAADA